MLHRSDEDKLAGAIEDITGTDLDTAQGLAAEVLWILAAISRDLAGEPLPEFTAGQPVEFRDGTMTATWQPGTFIRPAQDNAVIAGPGGLQYVARLDRVRALVDYPGSAAAQGHAAEPPAPPTTS